MDQELKAKWVAALRSGAYKQGTNTLRTLEGTFCCLGVLCDVMDRTGWNEFGEYHFDGYGLYSSQLPLEPGTEHAAIRETVLGFNQEPLIEMNDTYRKSFDDIADYIEANL